MKLAKELSLLIFEEEGYDYTIAVSMPNEYGCNFFYLNDDKYKFLFSMTKTTNEAFNEEEIIKMVYFIFHECEYE